MVLVQGQGLASVDAFLLAEASGSVGHHKTRTGSVREVWLSWLLSQTPCQDIHSSDEKIVPEGKSLRPLMGPTCSHPCLIMEIKLQHGFWRGLTIFKPYQLS
jgi:hypothetical protein